MIRRVPCYVLLAASVLFASGELSNRRAPGFALPMLDLSRYYDLQDFRGKVALIDFMSTTCPHCQVLSTTLENVKVKYGDKVAILSVVMPPDTDATVAKYRAVNKITTPIVYDMGQVIIAYLNARPSTLHVDLPHLFVVDRQGMIRNDFAYEEKTRPIFEGPGLFPEIDRLLK